MLIVHIVAERVRGRRGWVCIGAAVSFVLLSIVASLPGFYRDEGAMPSVLAYRVAFLVDCSLWVAVLVAWLLGAGWFERAPREPLRLWPSPLGTAMLWIAIATGAASSRERSLPS